MDIHLYDILRNLHLSGLNFKQPLDPNNAQAMLDAKLSTGLPFFLRPAVDDFNNAEAFKENIGQVDTSQDYSYIIGSGSANSMLYRNNILGRPVFLPVSITTIDNQVFELPNPILMISGSKNISTTVVRNKRGTVKEIISENDYQIKVLCQVINGKNTYPMDEIEELVRIWKRNELVTIKNSVTDMFLQNKNNAIIIDINIPSEPRSEQVQLVEISLLSDFYFQIEILE